MSRRPWELAFTAEPEEVGALRRIMRLHLGMWGLHDVMDEAQLCVSELVSNVITHVGVGTPATLMVSMKQTHLRIEVHDPDTRALPALVDASFDAEGGRGLALVAAVTDRWGVLLRPDRKVTWCELVTGLSTPNGHVACPGVKRAEVLLGLYAGRQIPVDFAASRLGSTSAEEAAIGLVVDLLHWFRAHGCDSDELIDRAQRHFEAQA
ncbi:ATP-binding protein [Streptomyces sp. NPDC005423]|uniref:ATP-binding protein n=1 Tax=Streptomyces sp. NPDC005423 TaxID=3155343 RepID=UPI0033BA762D